MPTVKKEDVKWVYGFKTKEDAEEFIERNRHEHLGIKETCHGSFKIVLKL